MHCIRAIIISLLQINLMEHFKRSTGRDFRINGAKLEAALREESSDDDDDEKDDDDDNDGEDNTEEEVNPINCCNLLVF